MLELAQVNKRFGGLHAVHDVSFSVPAGVIKAVIGPNGAGKTTLFNLIAGNLPLTSGSINFQDRRIDGLGAHRVAARGISRTFQNIKLFHGMTALENVMVGRHLRGCAGFWAGLLHPPGSRREERDIRGRARELLDFVDLGRDADVEAGSLAFGQQRAVELARALAAEPTLLLLDEPAAGLNIYETAEIGRLIRRIRDMGITVLLVEHDMSLVMEISDEVVVLNFGEKIAEDVPRAVQQHPEVIRIYLGEEDELFARAG